MDKIITTYKPIGSVKVNASKSYGHRYLIASLLCDENININNLPNSEDIFATKEAINIIKSKQESITINVNQSGSTLRMLLPIACYTHKHVKFAGDKSIFVRPLNVYENLLNKQGIKFIKNDDSFEVFDSLKIVDYEIDGDVSSQFISGLLFLLAFAKSKNSIKINKSIVSNNYIDMTLKVLNDVGYTFKKDHNSYKLVDISPIKQKSFDIELDYSNASNFIVLNALKENVKVNDLPSDSLQGDKVILDIVKSKKPFNVDIVNSIDLGPILFVYASCLNGVSHISGISRLQDKESNRLLAMTNELSKAGVDIKVQGDGVTINGKSSYEGDYVFETYNDHRVAMALTIFSTMIKGRSTIKNIECVNKSYPNFFKDFDNLNSNKMTLSIYKQSTLEECSSLIDVAYLNVPKYSYVYENDLDIDKAIKYCLNHNIEPILTITRVYLENEVEDIKSFINKYKDYKFAISDLGLLEIFKESGLINNVIYDSPIMMCNSSDLGLYASLGVNAVSMSNEIPISDIINAYRITSSNIFYQVFGRKLMFYSRRKLLSLYKEHSSSSFSLDNLSLREEKRNYEIPIYENEYGLYCFRHYHISLLKEIHNLRFIKYIFFESLTLTDEIIKEVLTIYRNAIDKQISIEQGLESISKLDLEIDDGFAYSDTIHQKEKIVQ